MRLGSLRKIIVTLAGTSLALSGCSFDYSEKFVENPDMLSPSDNTVMIEDCWRESLLKQSIDYPALRSFKEGTPIYLDKNFNFKAESLEGQVPQFLITRDLAECLESLGSGSAALGDVNNDGFVDVIGSNGQTWLNNAENSFTFAGSPYTFYPPEGVFDPERFVNPVIIGVTGPAGAVADLDNDGVNEIILPNLDRSDRQLLLFFNYVEGNWVNVTQKFPIDTVDAFRFVSSIKVADYDRDGFLDIVAGHNLLFNQFDALNTRESSYQGGVMIFKNNQGAGFVDVTSVMKINETIDKLDLVPIFSDGGPQFFPRAFTLDFGIADLDNDSWPDIVVAGDFGTSFILWNSEGKTFTSSKSSLFKNESAMGIAFYDINEDGFLDIFITQIFDENRILAACPTGRPCETSGNIVLMSQGPREYKDFGKNSGMFNGAWGWGATIQDLDNSGFPEIIQGSGLLVQDPGGLWKFRKGDTFIFKQQTPSNGTDAGIWSDVANEWGADATGATSSVLSYDFFSTGHPPLVLGPRKYNSLIYLENNISSKGNWVTINPIGDPSSDSQYKSNRQGLGAKIEVFSSDNYWWLYSGLQNSSYLSSGVAATRFGLGETDIVDIRVTFPSGKIVNVENVKVNQVLDVHE